MWAMFLDIAANLALAAKPGDLNFFYFLPLKGFGIKLLDFSASDSTSTSDST